jgi:hypothetical protein
LRSGKRTGVDVRYGGNPRVPNREAPDIGIVFGIDSCALESDHQSPLDAMHSAQLLVHFDIGPKYTWPIEAAISVAEEMEVGICNHAR